MNKLIKWLGILFYGLSYIIDGFFLSGVAAKLREWAKVMHDGVGNVSEKIGDITGMSRKDAQTLSNYALTAVSITFPVNKNQSELQQYITATLILIGYVCDTSGHNEKTSSLKTLQSEHFIPLIGKLLSRIKSIKTSKTPWGSLKQKDLSGIASSGIEDLWKECCVMEIILTDNEGSLNVHNLDNMYNAYKFIGALSGFGALALSMTNFVLTLRGGSLSGETPSPSLAPSFGYISTSSPTTQPYNDAVGLGIAGAVPIRFVSDTLIKMIFREEARRKQFLKKILSSLEKGLEFAKNNNQESLPKEIPAGLSILLEKERMNDGLKKISKLIGEYSAHNSSFVNSKISAANDAAAKAEQQRLDALAEKIEAEDEKNAAKSEKIKAESERDDANKTISDLNTRVDKFSADNLLNHEKIEAISKALTDMESDLNKERQYKEANSVVIESLATMIFENCFKECNITLNQKKTFINKLQNCLPEPRSSTINEILDQLEINCLEHKDEIVVTMHAKSQLSRAARSAPLTQGRSSSVPVLPRTRTPILYLRTLSRRNISNISLKSTLSKEGSGDKFSAKFESPKPKG